MIRFLLINIIIVLLFTSCKFTDDEITDNIIIETTDEIVDESNLESNEITDNNVTETTGEAIDENNKESNDIIDEQSDVKSESIKDKNERNEGDLDYLINYQKEIIKNLSHETYKPFENVTYGEFITYVMRAIGHDLKEEDNKDWTYPYIKKARIYNFIRQGEIEDYTKPINRGDVAKIISRTDKRISGIFVFRPSKEIEKLINDYNLIDEKYKIHVVKACDLGIMECNDGNFESEKVLTQEECVTIIRRIIDTSARKVPQFEEEVSTEITDQEIEEQLQYIEDNVHIGMSIDEVEKNFISSYRNLSFEDDMLDYYSYIPIRKISMYIYDGKNSYSNFEAGYTFYNDNNKEIGTITSIEDRFIIIDNEIKFKYASIYKDLRVFVYNLLMTRKAGLKIDIYSDALYKVIGANIFYVTGENNSINLIKYYSDGSKELIENIGENIIEYINSEISSPSTTGEEDKEENEIRSPSAIEEENTVHYVAVEGWLEVVELSTPYSPIFYGIPSFLRNIVGKEVVDEWLSQFESHTPDGRDIYKCNIVNAINEMDISKEDFIKADVVPGFTKEEVDVMFSGDQKQINKAFVNPGALLHNDEIYTVGWFATRDISDYEKEGITKDILNQYLEKIKDTPLREIHDEIYRKINNLITDKQIDEQLEYIQKEISIGKSMQEIHTSFNNLYNNYIIKRESMDISLPGYGDLYIYVFNNYDKVLKFSRNDPFITENGLLLGKVIEVDSEQIKVKFDDEKYNDSVYSEYNFFTDFRLFVRNMLVTRKAGIYMDITTNDKNEVKFVKITYVNGKDNQINMIKYNEEGIKHYENILEEIDKYL